MGIQLFDRPLVCHRDPVPEPRRNQVLTIGEEQVRRVARLAEAQRGMHQSIGQCTTSGFYIQTGTVVMGTVAQPQFVRAVSNEPPVPYSNPLKRILRMNEPLYSFFSSAHSKAMRLLKQQMTRFQYQRLIQTGRRKIRGGTSGDIYIITANALYRLRNETKGKYDVVHYCVIPVLKYASGVSVHSYDRFTILAEYIKHHEDLLVKRANKRHRGVYWKR